MSQQVKLQKAGASVVGTRPIDATTHRDHRPAQQ
jgi:hypothetical protein